MKQWTIKVFDGFSNIELIRFGTYEQIYNFCAGFPPSYIFSIT